MRKALPRIMAVLALSSLLFVQIASATVETTTSEFTDDMNSAVSLEASINEAGTVDLTWDAYTGENFKYYKAVGSQDIVEPKYPEDSYIGYIQDINVTSYTTTVEESPEGLNYYSLCVVLEGSIRGCTSISIEVPVREEEVVVTSEEEPVADQYTDDDTIAITLEGTLNELGKVELSWTAYEGGDLQWYKVVHSQTNAEAVYPADGYIAVYSDATIVDHLQTDVPEGTNYYRVCVITDTDMRGCSNTVTIENGEATIVEASNFIDTEGHWAETYIDDLAAKGVVEGISEDKFEPNRNVLRAEATKMVLLGLSIAETTCDATIFPDLDSDDWFCGIVTKAYKQGIISGDDGKLYPARNMTRAEAVKILLVTKGITPPTITENPFPDVNKDAWYAPYVYKASILGYIEGSNGQFEPNREITRAELAKIVSLASN